MHKRLRCALLLLLSLLIAENALCRNESGAAEFRGLLLVRPRVLGEKAETVIDLKERAYDYETDGPSLQVDDVEITLPAGVAVDELPAAVKVNAAGFRYGSETNVEKNVLHYRREYRVERFSVPRAELAEVNRVFTAIMADERSSAVLKQQ